MTPTNKNVLLDREKYIGSSEISTIMGINHFKTRFDLLLEKSGLKEPEQVNNIYVDFGSKMEKYIRDYINKDYVDDPFLEDTIIKEQEIISLRTNYDGLNKTSALEIKTTSVIHESLNEYKYYLVQLLYGMMLGNRKNGILAIYKRNEDFALDFKPERLQIFNVNIDDYKELCNEINKAVEQFRTDLEKIKSNPFLVEEDLIPIEVAKLSNMIVALENRLAKYKEMEKEQKELKAELKEAMENKGLTKWITSNGTKITLVPDGEDKEVKKFNEKKFKEEHQEEYEKYLENKIQKGKAGYILITLPKGEE